ncbi:DeoR/GlpR family DNA-binding transcription regulator [Georgenia sp. Z1344]|uniref:DeoR/GlpR family DNA-binding transcription regulator n=1 Tax=Georgenia sp. Z1344 TaxID=3416706 RepID=UPI003CE9F551
MNAPPAPMKDRRQRLATMAELVLEAGTLSVEDVAAQFGVSTMTVYRDLAELERGGIVTRTRGTVTARATSMSEASAEFRSTLNTATKRRLAARAVEEVHAGSTIMIDDSTTLLSMVPLLDDRGPVTIVTHSQAVAREAAALRSVRLFVTGGRYRPELDSLYGSTTLATLRSVRADICFMSTTALAGGELFHPLEENADVKRAMLASSTRSILVTDASKFQHAATHRVASVADFDLVVVDSAAPADELAIMREHGVEVAQVDTAD